MIYMFSKLFQQQRRHNNITGAVREGGALTLSNNVLHTAVVADVSTAEGEKKLYSIASGIKEVCMGS